MNLDLLRPWQRENASHLLRLLGAGQNALDASDTGTGKTFSALAVADALNCPTLALVPKISVTSWHRWARYLGISISALNVEAVRTGRTLYGSWRNNPPPGMVRDTMLRCMNCQCEVDDENPEPCYAHHRGIHCVDSKKKRWNYGPWTWNPGIKFLIIDEAHNFGALRSLNAQMLIAARRQGIPVLMMTATPAASVLDFRTLGYVLGLHQLRNFESWAMRRGCVRSVTHHGLVWRVSDERRLEIMAALNRELFPSRGVRTRTSDIAGFPDCTVTAELYDVKDPQKIDALYADMAAALDALKARQTLDKCPEMMLTATLRQREEIELLKVPIMVDLTKDYLSKGKSVALFVNFSRTMAELRARLKTNCYIDGSQTSTKRQECIDSFQADRQRAIVVNSQAGGVSVSLHDVRGEFPRVGLAMPGYSARMLRQIFGRLPREGGKSPAFYRVIFAAKTIEIAMHAAISRKLDNGDALIDADLRPENLTFRP